MVSRRTELAKVMCNSWSELISFGKITKVKFFRENGYSWEEKLFCLPIARQKHVPARREWEPLKYCGIGLKDISIPKKATGEDMQRLMYRYRIHSSLIINGILSNIAMWFSNFPPLKSSGAYAYFDVVSRDKSLELTVGMTASAN